MNLKKKSAEGSIPSCDSSSLVKMDVGKAMTFTISFAAFNLWRSND